MSRRGRSGSQRSSIFNFLEKPTCWFHNAFTSQGFLVLWVLCFIIGILFQPCCFPRFCKRKVLIGWWVVCVNIGKFPELAQGHFGDNVRKEEARNTPLLSLCCWLLGEGSLPGMRQNLKVTLIHFPHMMDKAATCFWILVDHLHFSFWNPSTYLSNPSFR